MHRDASRHFIDRFIDMNKFERLNQELYLHRNMSLGPLGWDRIKDTRAFGLQGKEMITHVQITPTRLLHSSQDNDSDGICPSRGRRCPYLCNFVGCVATSHPCSQQRLEEGPEALQFKCVLLAVSI